MSRSTKKPSKPAPPLGKRLSEIDRARGDASATASNVARQLMFAGLASVWLLREEGARPLNNSLLIALVGFSLALLVDLAQYVYCAAKWRRFYNEQYEKHKSDEALIDIPDALVKPMYRFANIKIALLGVAYVVLIYGAAGKLRVFERNKWPTPQDVVPVLPSQLPPG